MRHNASRRASAVSTLNTYDVKRVDTDFFDEHEV